MTSNSDRMEPADRWSDIIGKCLGVCEAAHVAPSCSALNCSPRMFLGIDGDLA